jgi:hypothetical protein
MNSGREGEALLLTVLYVISLAMPWLYSYSRPFFDAIAIFGLFIFCSMCASLVFTVIFAYFNRLLK